MNPVLGLLEFPLPFLEALIGLVVSCLALQSWLGWVKNIILVILVIKCEVVGNLMMTLG
jgi:hypothetical protein